MGKCKAVLDFEIKKNLGIKKSGLKQKSQTDSGNENKDKGKTAKQTNCQ
jgi:hypothetical protein